MSGFRVSATAERRLREIHAYTHDAWGEAQADRYIHGLFAAFEDIAAGRRIGRAVPAEFGVDGFYIRQDRHYIYWRRLSDGAVGIVTVLHERMHQIDRFRDDASA
jgi:toxin ParE1/3/4